MSKKDVLDEFTNVLAAALRHKIGSIVNNDEIYAQRYAKDAESLLKEAEKISQKANWNNSDKTSIKQIVKKKLKQELEKKDFIDNRKFELIDSEVEDALASLNLI